MTIIIYTAGVFFAILIVFITVITIEKIRKKRRKISEVVEMPEFNIKKHFADLKVQIEAGTVVNCD